MGNLDTRRMMARFRPAILGIPALLLVAAMLLPAISLKTEAAQENEPEIQVALARMNLYRSWLGLEPMTIDPALQAAAEAHVEYYRLNYGDPHLAGMGLHQEVPGNPGFTGEWMQDRAEFQGYDGWVNENAGISGSMLWSLDWFMGTINHRLPILDPRYTEVGLATVSDGDIVFEIINFGMPVWGEESEPEWTVWPPDGATGVNLAFDGEAPNPFPGASFPTGVPITISNHSDAPIQLEDWSIQANGSELQSFGSIGDGFLSSNTALVTAQSPLEPGTTYNVEVSGSAGQESFSLDWSFTTRETHGEPIALNGDSGPSIDDFPEDEPAPEPPDDDDPPARSGSAASEDPPPPPPISTQSGSPYPNGLRASTGAIQELWGDVDGPVYKRQDDRSWLYGPDIWAIGPEAYLESTNGERDVYYLDKARIEVNDFEDPETPMRDLTSGLLVRDMMAGRAQVGHDSFNELEPAGVPIAGDSLEFNERAPTYATFGQVASLDGDNRADPMTGDPIVATIDKDGETGTQMDLASFVEYGYYEESLGHNIADVFMAYFETLPVDWEDMVGMPLTEPYWVRANVEGDSNWVLVQAFERRVVTFTPENDPNWQVEMGNVGRHYYTWRYNMEAPEPGDSWPEDRDSGPVG